jgi:hypothetical protein
VRTDKLSDAELHVPDLAVGVIAFKVDPHLAFPNGPRFPQHKPVDGGSERYSRVENHAISGLRKFKRQISACGPGISECLIRKSPAKKAHDLIATENDVVVAAVDLPKQSGGPMSKRQTCELWVVHKQSDCHTELRIGIVLPHGTERDLRLI